MSLKEGNVSYCQNTPYFHHVLSKCTITTIYEDCKWKFYLLHITSCCGIPNSYRIESSVPEFPILTGKEVVYQLQSYAFQHKESLPAALKVWELEDKLLSQDIEVL